jgi:L-ribulose-5-phosphate 3-epimerase
MLQLGYNTNGLVDITPWEAAEGLANIGYRGVALTLDRQFLNPFASDHCDKLSNVREMLTKHRLSCVIETGARFLLDPEVKHEPTLVSQAAEGRARRIEFLCRAIDTARALDAECVSLWSGTVRDAAPEREAMDRLVTGLFVVLDHAAAKEVNLAFEPEPDMFIDTMARYGDLLNELAARRADLSRLRLTIDVGHLHCQGELPIADQIRRWGDQLANVHIEDMRAGIHEHLMFGEGEIDFPPVIAALAEIGYAGPVNVELSRHSQDGLAAARQAYDYLKPLIDTGL